jgi:signal peptidase I
MEQTLDERPTTTPSKSRNPFIAFLLSLLLPGLGQVYNGQLKKAAICFGLIMVVPFLFGITRGTTFFYGLFALLMIEIVLRIYVIIDGVKNAKRQKDYVPKSYNTWYYHLLIAIAMVIILWLYDLKSVLGIQTFKLSSPSNNPTLQVGDCFVADMKAYKNKELGYGDIVVFKSPEGQIWNFRVVGLPNDKLEINDNIVTINGKQSKATFIKETLNDDVAVYEFIEELPNGHKHHINKFKQSYDSTKATIMDIVVPEESYYLLGDNRDNAADSRYIGSVKRQDILGRVIYSYWGKTTDRINIDFRYK